MDMGNMGNMGNMDTEKNMDMDMDIYVPYLKRKGSRKL